MRFGWLLICLVATSTSPALAGPGADIDLQAFRPAIDSRGFITVNSPEPLGHGELSFGLVTSWGKGLLRFEDADRYYEVEHMVSPTLMAALGARMAGLAFEVALSVPFVVMSGDRGPDDNGGTPTNPNDDERFGFEGQGLGDVGIHVKTRLARQERAGVSVAMLTSVTVPTATTSDAWLGDESPTLQLGLALERRLGAVRVAANGGFRYRSAGESEFRDSGGAAFPFTGGTVRVGSTLPFGAAAAYSISQDRFEALAEVFGALPLAGENYFPLEATVGAKVYLARSSFLTFGAGIGLANEQAANPDARAFLGIVFEPRSSDRDGDGIRDPDDKCPLVPEDIDAFEDLDGCPDEDNDRDRILDRDDACPNVPEDRDGDRDDDGCPEDGASDRDGDGFLDVEDACPDEPEDFDGFEDRDGCPDVDNDHDKILDVDDLCPNEPEDVDGYEDADGCPDPDNDRDRIVDTDDQCPGKDGQARSETAEVFNGKEDDDGCPDGRVRMGETILYILDKIHFEFDSDVIRSESFPILDEIATTLSMNERIARVEVQGHTDERGGDRYNLELSQRRAEAVVAYLVSAGVEADRLVARGYGETVPKERAHSERAWAVNRRVEFHILEQAGQ